MKGIHDRLTLIVELTVDIDQWVRVRTPMSATGYWLCGKHAINEPLLFSSPPVYLHKHLPPDVECETCCTERIWANLATIQSAHLAAAVDREVLNMVTHHAKAHGLVVSEVVRDEFLLKREDE